MALPASLALNGNNAADLDCESLPLLANSVGAITVDEARSRYAAAAIQSLRHCEPVARRSGLLKSAQTATYHSRMRKQPHDHWRKRPESP